MQRRAASTPLALLLGIALGIAGTLEAAVVRFEITSREPFSGGRSFGKAGPYERIVGRVSYAIDPALRQNQAIVDLNLAPTNADGKVEFRSDLFILAPQDLRKGNGALLYDVNNRGNKLALRFFNFGKGGNDPKVEEDAGDGFLFQQGFTVVWNGWDGELLPGGDRMRLFPPVATEAGKPITGLVRCEFIPESDKSRIELATWANHGSYRPTEEGIRSATLTWRLRAADPRVEIPRAQWKLRVTEVESDSSAQLPKVEVELPAGMRQGYIYELIYQAREPLVHGVCFASVRDLIAAIRTGSGENNPLMVGGAPVLTRAHGFGVSQSGRFLREFLHSGFNEDEQGKKVFDGLIPHVSGSGLGSFNHRFAQPTRHASQHDHDTYLPDRFPFAYETQEDSFSKSTDGILRRAEATKTLPYVLHTQSAAEYWTRSGSLTHTDTAGKRDGDVPDQVRIYLFGGTQHGPASYPLAQGISQNLPNPGDYRPFLRALLLALDRWARNGAPAPPSVYPRIARGTLVGWGQTSSGFPALPGIRYPEVIRQPPLLELGSRWTTQRIIDQQPPRVLHRYTVLVPKCDSDGNELDCLSPPEVAVPLGTFTGWNLRSAASGAENELVSLTGSYIPFTKSKADREVLGDPRPSIEERYSSLEIYVDRLHKKCDELARDGYLLPSDIGRIVKQQRELAEPLFRTAPAAGVKP